MERTGGEKNTIPIAAININIAISKFLVTKSVCIVRQLLTAIQPSAPEVSDYLGITHNAS